MRKARLKERWKKWEIALALSLTITLSCTGGVPVCWWGVIFPNLAGPEYVRTETAAFDGAAGPERVELRFRLLEWARELWAAAGGRKNAEGA